MAANLTLNMEAQLTEIERIHAAVKILSQAEGWPPELLFQIELVLEEIGTNIIKYGQDGDRETDINITLTSDSTSLRLEIVDSGKPFDPFAEAPPPDLDSPIPDRPIGGLGVHLVQELMDESYYRREDGMNKVTLIKHKSV
ncbi:MAG: ATP-binding protein [Rhodospirillales bacterium]|nr:ATP-binding protein [Rhodospirillales bacterium]